MVSSAIDSFNSNNVYTYIHIYIYTGLQIYIKMKQLESIFKLSERNEMF